MTTDNRTPNDHRFEVRQNDGCTAASRLLFFLDVPSH